MALPRALSLNAKNDLEMRLTPVTQELRGQAFPPVTPNTPQEVRAKMLAAIEFENLTGELLWKIGDGPFSMNVADDAGPWWSLTLDKQGTRSVLQINGKEIEIAEEDLRETELHLVLDASVAEFFCNSQQVLTTRIYRKPSGKLHLQIDEANRARLTTMQAWPLRPISKDRLTK